jgi:hypothetical protein
MIVTKMIPHQLAQLGVQVSAITHFVNRNNLYPLNSNEKVNAHAQPCHKQ